MTLRHLGIFREVCNLESITLTANKLNIAQPSVSVIIKELENYYGVRLFDRMNRRLYITDEGRLLLQYADTIIQQFKEAENLIRNSEYVSSLRIGSNVSVGNSVLPLVLREFQSQYPQVMVTSRINNSDYIESQLLQNELDLALIDQYSDQHNFHSEFLYEEQMIAVCSKSYAKNHSVTISLQELAEERLLLRERGSGSRDVVDMVFKINQLSPNIVMESISTTALIQAALNGLGILFLPQEMFTQKDFGDALTRVFIRDTKFIRKYSIIFNRSKYLTSNISSFISTAHKTVHALEPKPLEQVLQNQYSKEGKPII